jgi:hypothetical protein
MKINATQAEVLLDWMLRAAEAAVRDHEEGEKWRIDNLGEKVKTLMEEFNEAAE